MQAQFENFTARRVLTDRESDYSRSLDPAHESSTEPALEYRNFYGWKGLVYAAPSYTAYIPTAPDPNDRNWSVAEAVIRDYIQHPEREEASANPASFRAAVRVLHILKFLGIKCPIPFIDGDGDALLLWEDGKRVISLAVTENAINFLATNDGRLERASGAQPYANGIPHSIWRHLPTITSAPSILPIAASSNATSLNIYLTRTLSDAWSSIQACLETTPATWARLVLERSYFNPNMSAKNPSFGQSILQHPNTRMISV